MIPKVVLDPSFFWIFAETDTEEEAKEAWDACKAWLKDANHGVSLLVHSKSVDRLQDAGMIPAFDAVKDTLQRLNLDYVVSPPELKGILDRFLSNMISVEEEAPVKDAAFEDISVSPRCFDVINETEVREHSVETLCLSALNAAVGYRLNYAFPRLGDLGCSIKASAVVAVAEAELQVPAQFTHTMQLIKAPSSFKALLNPQDIWDEAVDADEINYAIRLAAERLTSDQLPASVIGSAFFETLVRNQAVGHGKAWSAVTLAKCAQVLAGVPEVEVKPFTYEKSGKANSKIRKRTRDGAEAYRVHIPTGALSLRLMLWRTSKGWEFANVGPKFELVIENG